MQSRESSKRFMDGCSRVTSIENRKHISLYCEYGCFLYILYSLLKCEVKNKNKIHKMQVLRDCCFDYMETGFFGYVIGVMRARKSHAMCAYLWGTRLNACRIYSFYSYTIVYERNLWMQHNQSKTSARFMDEQIIYVFENQWASVLFYVLFCLLFVILVDSIGFLFVLFLLFSFSDPTVPVMIKNLFFKEEAFLCVIKNIAYYFKLLSL